MNKWIPVFVVVSKWKHHYNGDPTVYGVYASRHAAREAKRDADSILQGHHQHQIFAVEFKLPRAIDRAQRTQGKA